jgi:hypothetical protein
MPRTDPQRFNAAEAAQRLKKVLRGAFAGPPTPLKDIPKKTGESRRAGSKKTTRRASSAATSKNARPAP